MFLTASFKLHEPSTRKRQAMCKAMRMATAARAALYQAAETRLQHLLDTPTIPKPQRKREVAALMAELSKHKANFRVNGEALKKVLRDSVQRDVQALLNSRLDLLAEHDDRAGSAGLLPVKSRLVEGLEMLKASISKQGEDAARDTINIRERNDLRPLSFVRWDVYAGFKLVKNTAEKWFAWLPIGTTPVSATEPLTDIRTGEPFKLPGTPGILVPLSFGEKHQARILKQGTPRSAILRLDEKGDFYLNVAVELEPAQAEVGDTVIGIDRGMEVIAAYAAKHNETIIDVGLVDGTALRQIQRKHECALQHAQQTGKRCRINWKKHIDALVHETANKIADLALQHSARVVLEDLDNIKNSPGRRKQKGTVRTRSERNLNKQLVRQVYGKLEGILTYKLALRGLPAPKQVYAAGTSITCSACNHKDKQSRISRDIFRCTACGHEAHADINASINIATRGQKFFAGGKRRQQESGVIPVPHATGTRAYDGSTIAAYPDSGAKHTTQVPQTPVLFGGAELKGANKHDVRQLQGESSHV